MSDQSRLSRSPHAARLALYQDWRQRLAALCGEMEEHFGEPGAGNQDPLDSAVHVAFYVAMRTTEFWEAKVADHA